MTFAVMTGTKLILMRGFVTMRPSGAMRCEAGQGRASFECAPIDQTKAQKAVYYETFFPRAFDSLAPGTSLATTSQ